jgi:hypothetical protein
MLNVVTMHQTQQDEPGTGWIPAEPYYGPFMWRLRDAWAVLCGRAHAVVWPSPKRSPR